MRQPFFWVSLRLGGFVFLGGVAGGFAGGGDFIDQGVGLGSVIDIRLGLLDRSRSRLGSGQRADGEADLVLLLVDGGDLRIDDVADGQDLFGLADAAVGDLADVIRPSTPGSTSANAPKGMSFTMVTFATSPTWKVFMNLVQGLPLGSL